MSCDPGSIPERMLEIELPVDVVLHGDEAAWLPFIKAALLEASSNRQTLLVRIEVPADEEPGSAEFESSAIRFANAAIYDARQGMTASAPHSSTTTDGPSSEQK